MDRQYYVDLAAQGLRMPIGADLVLHEQAAPEEILFWEDAAVIAKDTVLFGNLPTKTFYSMPICLSKRCAGERAKQ